MARLKEAKLCNIVLVLLATQSIEARARQKGRASLYNWQSINEDLKLEKRKRDEGWCRLILYTILGLRDGNYLKLSAIVRYNPLISAGRSTSSHQRRNITPPSKKACPQALYIRRVFLSLYLIGNLLSSLFQYFIYLLRYFRGSGLLG